MKTITLTTPQRTNFSIDARTSAKYVFEKLDGTFVLSVEVDYVDYIEDDKRYKITYPITEDKVLIKWAKKHLDPNALYDLQDLDFRFRTMQKRMKEQVRKQAKNETPVVEKEQVLEPQATPEVVEPKEEVKEPKIEAKIVKIERPKAVGLEGQLQDIVFNVLESDFTTQTLQNKMIQLGIEPNRTEVVVKRFDGTKKNVGTQHKDFKKILQCISARVNIALVGEAGSGKTTAVKNVAEALDLKFYAKSVSAQTGVHEFFGYQDANGKYVRTLFREAYENGGVFLLDEFDAGNPNVLASMNQATANGYCAFADGMVEKHEDFVVVMAGNTFGNGATQDYVGRNKIDKATLDRFAFIEFGYDEKLERAISKNIEWCQEVQSYRAKAKKNRVRAIISPRATFQGEALLASGMDLKTVKELVIFKGLNDKERELLK